MPHPLAPTLLVAFALALAGCRQSSDAVEIDPTVTAPSTSTIAPASPTRPAVAPAPDAVVQPAAAIEWTATGPCTVSALLVPSCGAWLGATTPSRALPVNYETGLAEYEAAAQNQPDILHFYKRDTASFPTKEEIALAERPGLQRSILFYNWKPSSTLSWRQVANGGADRAIETVADGVRQYPHTMFLTVWHEPEDDQGAHGTPEDYVAMYRHVVTRLRELGVTNVVYVMNFMGFSKWSDLVDDLYPGDDVVDWIAYDPYGFASHSSLGEFLDEPGEGWPGFYTWATRKAPDKPIMLGEWGIDLGRQPRAPAILNGGVANLHRRFPQLKALVYWNDEAADGVLVRLDQQTELGLKYTEAYRQFANHPYFNSTDPSLAP